MFRAKSEFSAGLAEQVFDSIEEGLLVFDRRDRVRFCNRAFEAMWSVSRTQIIGQGLDEITARIARRALNRGSLDEFDHHLATAGVTAAVELILEDDRYLELYMQPLTRRGATRGRIWRFRNLTLQKRSELAMLHSQKLESLGVLAGGMAHDFNNLLSSILGHSELGLGEVDKGSPAADSLSAIGRAAERASELTQQLLAYAGKGTVLVEPVDLSALVVEVIALLEVSIDHAIDLRLDLAEELPPIIADATQLRQVVMNLVLNAAEATTEGGGVEITTGIDTIGLPEIERSVHDTATAPGEFVFIRVTDTGDGMDEETLAKIFDPFFSTKFTGRGLGLAAVLGIVRGHRGLLRVESRLGKGTSFTVDLPRGYRSDQPYAADAP